MLFMLTNKDRCGRVADAERHRPTAEVRVTEVRSRLFFIGL